jgi:hypothetical protein
MTDNSSMIRNISTKCFLSESSFGSSLHYSFAQLLIYSILSLILIGCPSPKETQKKELPPPETPAPKPVIKKAPVYDNIIRVASLDLATPRKFKIEQKHIDQIALVLKQDSVDLFAVQSVARYPGVTTRVDIIDGISSATGMVNVFAANNTVSGYQEGNAVFSRYPVLSHDNKQYDNIQSANFESALQTVIDCGREVVLVSTALPPKAPKNDIMVCMSALNGFHSYYIDDPLIVTGNLPHDAGMKSLASYENVKLPSAAHTPGIWFSSEKNAMKLLRSKTVQSLVGIISIADFGLAPKESSSHEK